MPSPQLENIGLALQGFGAGIQGQLPAFNQMLQSREVLDQNRQKAEQEMVAERQKTLFKAAQTGLSMLDSGNYDGLIQFGMQRTQALSEMGANPEDTQRLTQLAIAARNGSEEAEKLLRDELTTTVQIGQGMGILDSGETEAFKTLASRAKAAGLKPGSQEYQLFMEAGGKADSNSLSVVQRYSPNGDAQTILTDKQGKFFDLENNPIKLAKEDRIIEGSNLTGTADELGIGNTELKELRNSEVATLSFIDTVEDAVGKIEQFPDVNTFVASAAAVVNDIQQEAKAVVRNLGFEIDDKLLDVGAYAQTFDQLGIENERTKSLITSLAYQAAAAAGQEGRGISDRDVKRFVEEIGADASDPRAFRATLLDVAERSARRFKTNYRVRTKQDYEGDLGISRLQSQGAKAITTQEEFDALPPGSTYISPDDGKTYRKP